MRINEEEQRPVFPSWVALAGASGARSWLKAAPGARLVAASAAACEYWGNCMLTCIWTCMFRTSVPCLKHERCGSAATQTLPMPALGVLIKSGALGQLRFNSLL